MTKLQFNRPMSTATHVYTTTDVHSVPDDEAAAFIASGVAVEAKPTPAIKQGRKAAEPVPTPELEQPKPMTQPE